MRPLLTLAVFMSLALFSCKKDKGDDDIEKVDLNIALDARYQVTGSMKDFSTKLAFTGYYPHEITLEKSGNSGTMIPKELGFAGHVIMSLANKTYYGTFGPKITIDPNTNKIISITNSYGQPSASGRSAVLDPSGVNAIDPITNEIKIKYWMDEIGEAQPHRASFDETWTWLGKK